MSSKEALDLDGSKRKGRAQKVGSVWESRMMDNQHKTAQQNSQKICRSSSMSNAEFEVDKQTPSGASGKIKTVEIARQRSDLGIKKSPLQIKRARSAVTATSVRDEINLVKLRKVKSDSAKLPPNHSKSDGTPTNLVDQHTKKSDDDKTVVADSVKDLEKSKLGINQVKVITDNADQILTPSGVDYIDGEEDDDNKEEKEEEVEKEMEVEVEKRSLEIKDIIITLQQQKPKKLVIEEKKKLLHSNDRSPPITPTVKRIAPAARIHPTPAKLNPISDHDHGTSSRLQSLADLIMWRDVSRSAFVFGIGSFAIISSSYTKDLNISCISVISYLGLVYLAVSFIFRSLISRGNIDMDSTDEEYVVGEEEAVWLMKLVLPYVNEFLSKLRTLFSGDPATTMKLAVLLFILARCGSSITIWKMTKLGFFGVFMLPKLCSSYSSQLAAYGTFWIGRFGDAWETCSHKKAVAFGIFCLVWNLSSVVARIWAVFLLFVALRYYYQHCRIKEEGLQQEVVTQNSYSGKRVQTPKLNIIDIKK